MNTYTYEIINLHTTTANPDRPNDVVKILTVVTATNPAGQSKTLNCMFDMTPKESFTQFDQLTQEQVSGWIDAAVQWPTYKKELDSMFDNLPMVQLEQRPLPWLPTEAQSIAEFQIQNPDPTTSSSNTTTVVSPIVAQVSEEYIKALVYQVLEEVNESQV
jgi:hypothetical protein